MGQVWTLDDWNGIIQRVNDLAQNPDSGCDPVDTLPEVDAPHKWSTGDIQQVHDKLIEICPDSTFETIPEKWKQSTVDEINDAISKGWCNCEKCQAEDEEYVLFSYGNTACPEIRVTECPATESPCQAPAGGYFDWYSAAQGIKGFGEGIGGSYQLRRSWYKDEELQSSETLIINTFDCAGNQTQPMPVPAGEPPYAGGDYGDRILCIACNTWQPYCFFTFCGCAICGYGNVCTPNPPQDPPCEWEVDEDYVRSHRFPTGETDWDCHTFESVWRVVKRCDSAFHGEGTTCRKCCSDGIGFCDDGDCPGDEACS